MLCSVLAWHQAETLSRQKAAQELTRTRYQKLRESCYCDCQQIKSKYFTSTEKNFDDTKLDQSQDYNEYDKNLIDQCACVCHGMYNLNDMFEDAENEEHKKTERLKLETLL